MYPGVQAAAYTRISSRVTELKNALAAGEETRLHLMLEDLCSELCCNISLCIMLVIVEIWGENIGQISIFLVMF